MPSGYAWPYDDAAADMREAISQHWDDARRHEATGNIAEAKAAYAAMLAIDPMQVVPKLRLSRFAQVADRYVEARSLALDASRIASATGTSKDVGFITLRLLAFAEDAEVARLIQSLDWSDSETLRQSAVLAQHLWLVGRHELALDFLAHVSTRVRPNPLLSYTRANVLRSLGRLDEASEHYEYALQLNPNDAHVHRSLSYHQATAPLGARVQKIQAARRHHPAGSLEQAQLLYALFKELDDAGDTASAWAALEEGAAIMRSKMPHAREAEAEGFALLRNSSVIGALPPAVPAHGGPVPLFIVGMPRTGTTLLDRVLGNHPEIVSLGERNDFDAAVSEVSDHFFQGGLKDSGSEKLRGLDLRRVGERYLERVTPLASGRQWFIDKNPQNFFNACLILRAIPHAKIICLRRDPMDACFSNLKELFEGGAYSYSYGLEDLAAHQRHFTRQTEYWKTIAPDSFHVVDYESLVLEGAGTLRGLMDFCGLQSSASMLDITANTGPVSTASSSQVRQPIHDRSIGAWKRYASRLEPLRKMLEGIP